MSLRLRIAIGAAAVAIAAFAVLGDGFFVGVLGLPPHSGRIVTMGVLLVAGIVFFLMTSHRLQPQNSDAKKKRR